LKNNNLNTIIMNWIKSTYRISGSVLILLLSVCSFNLCAQQVDCSRKFYQAESYYNRGMIDSAITTLTPCLENMEFMKKEPKERKVNIFRLAALSFYVSGQPEEASEYVKKMVELDPDYRNNFVDGDLGEFRDAVLNLESTPFLTAGIKVGANFPMITIEEQYSKWMDPLEGTKIEGKMGYEFHLFGAYSFSERISVKIEPGLMISRNTYFGSTYESQQYSYDQEFVMFEIPIICSFNILPGKKINPYVEVGIGTRFLLNESTGSPYGDFYATQMDGAEIVASYVSKMNLLNIQFGGGLTYALKGGGITLGIRYELNLNDSDMLGKFDDITSFDDIPTDKEVYHVDDIVVMGLNHLRIYIGYTYYLRSKVF